VVNKKTVLTTGEAAKYCDVNFRTIIRWIEKGYLNAYKLPGRGDNRIPVESLVEFLQTNNMPIPDDLVQKNKRILIVEDIPEMARSISRTLTTAGYETQIASNGFIAGDLLNSFMPALMTLDIKMPGLSGIEVLKYTKNNSSLKNIKIIVISAQTEEHLQEALDSGADQVLVKPFTNKELSEIVDSLMD